MRKIPLRPQAHGTVLRMWSEERLIHTLPVQEFGSTGLDFPWFLSLNFTEIAPQSHVCIHAHVQMCTHTQKKCSFRATRITLGKIWLQFSHRRKSEFPHLHIHFWECNFCFSYMAIVICNLNITYVQCPLQSKLGERNE